MNRIALLVGLFLTACSNSWSIPHAAVHRIGIVTTTNPIMEIGSGSGFAISKHLVVTAAHVCVVALIEDVRLKTDQLDFVIVKIDPRRDLCLLYTETVLENFLTIARDPPVVDDEIKVIGHPLGVPTQIVTTGTFAGYESINGTVRAVLSCQAYSGNSGGPVLNDRNAVVGVLIAGAAQYTQLTIAVSWSDLREFLEYSHRTQSSISN